MILKFLTLLFCFSLLPNYLVSERIDLINFNVYQDGLQTYGHFKVPDCRIKSDFFIHKQNETHMRFGIHSKDPYPLVLGGDVAITHQNGVINTKGRLYDAISNVRLNLDSNLTFVGERHEAKTRIDFDVPDTINGTYLYNLKFDNGIPVSFSHNLTTNPPGLIDYHSGFKSSNMENKTKIDLDISLKSNEWEWMNTNLNQLWVFNLTSGYESMNATNPAFDIDVIANWTRGPIEKKYKELNFRGKNGYLPSYRLKYIIDGDNKQMFYEKI